ncbi:MAG: SIR2 family NAD-dependent protein deacylase [Aquificaceae bacterium]|uniref:SIR2 family NAD-dependent protein deacylase n=1 Tax=Hydrogenobacter sp. Uz 6-8 TaxID=3384828 RepID=UPI000F288474|nr:MAG: NAD-dependent deacylase [Aquificota bacterium]
MGKKPSHGRDIIISHMKLAVLTGAGISAESGIPTFRGKDGLWRNFRPEELATPEAFARNPVLVWEWYLWRRSIIAKAEPNEGHMVLVELERRLGDGFLLITQNVDGLHQKAGSQRIVELHGNIWKVRCLACGLVYYDYRTSYEDLPPKCRGCGGLIRPHVVWFGESLPENALSTAYLWAQSCQVFVSIGTSAVVYPAAELPFIAKRYGAKVIEINPESTPLSSIADVIIREPASTGVKKLLEVL